LPQLCQNYMTLYVRIGKIDRLQQASNARIDMGCAVAKSPWSFKTALELSVALKARKVSAVELAHNAIGRIERHDGRINAVCVRDFSRALDAARSADTALARGETRPLLGIPLTVKESFNVAGLPTTWGFPAYKNFVPKQDALAIVRVKDAGGVILGKTNVPFRLGDLQSYNDIYGTTNNPYDLGRTPGGSSGGSAAALAAGYGPLSLGTDIGGSLRVPAFHCGIYAHNPSFGLVPRRGHTLPPFPPIGFEQDMAVVGAKRGRSLAATRRHGWARPAGSRRRLQARAAAVPSRRAEGFPRARGRHSSHPVAEQGSSRKHRKTCRQPRKGTRNCCAAKARCCPISWNPRASICEWCWRFLPRTGPLRNMSANEPVRHN
jgi:hypothetical protein